jgi:hypothetical protein
MRMTRLEVLIRAFPKDEQALRALAETHTKLLAPSPDEDPAFDLVFSFGWNKTPQGDGFWRKRYDSVNKARAKGAA